MAADTSSAPAASTAVVGPATAAFAALNAELIVAKSAAAAAIISGAAITNDIAISSPAELDDSVVQRPYGRLRAAAIAVVQLDSTSTTCRLLRAELITDLFLLRASVISLQSHDWSFSQFSVGPQLMLRMAEPVSASR
ncbi:hypothetical protein LAUMK7_03364 [Mycobacterium kansasii]|nr:hypothetical protein LAUMK22_02753 [Mycobacterium kansasii]VAZ67268.1 hypothetical protein LAUMK40_03407 [Mycobacterium kansasii]VAZ76409.1 hypothetical protein LAUMK7_03364 [Mycobacterium kansasii]